MNTRYALKGVYRGKVAQNFGVETAMVKHPVREALYLDVKGLAGDECADKRHHGGLERALHQYPLEHYEFWRQRYPENTDWMAPGMGENLSSEGMLETNVCIGDRYRWGEAIIEVSQPRSPCFKLNRRWQVEELSRHMQDISRCGWLYRVIQPGLVGPEHPLILVERPDNAMTIALVCELYFGTPLDTDGLKLLREQEALSESWMSKVIQRLDTGEVENWNFRLFGHP